MKAGSLSLLRNSFLFLVFFQVNFSTMKKIKLITLCVLCAFAGFHGFAQSVSPAMVKYVEDYVGFNITTIQPNDGISISNVLPSTKISRINFSTGKVQEGLILTAILPNGRGSIKDFIHIINKENFVKMLMEFKKNGYKKPWLFTKIDGGKGMYKIDISGLDLNELIKLSKLDVPIATIPNTVITSKQITDTKINE